MGLFIAKYEMRYHDLLVEHTVKLHNGAILQGNPSAAMIASMLEKSRYALLRGIAIEERGGRWVMLVWDAGTMTHNEFYRAAQASGFDIVEDIGLFIADSEETIEREAMASSLGYRTIDGLVVGLYPNAEWSWTTLAREFPRVFRGTQAG